jgi:hypothetical protein
VGEESIHEEARMTDRVGQLWHSVNANCTFLILRSESIVMFGCRAATEHFKMNDEGDIYSTFEWDSNPMETFPNLIRIA